MNNLENSNIVITFAYYYMRVNSCEDNSLKNYT